MKQREIKFRAQRTDTEEWVYFDLGDLIQGKARIDFFEIDIPRTYKNWCQFTGLLDKNGKEIYEGDITESQGMTGHIFREEVVFWEGCFCHKTSDNRGHIFNPKHEVVIGNLYENPTLLTSHE